MYGIVSSYFVSRVSCLVSRIRYLILLFVIICFKVPGRIPYEYKYPLSLAILLGRFGFISCFR